MASLNKVLLIGNLTRDPEVRQTPGGSTVCKLGLATNRRYKAQSGEMKEETTFVDVTVWGPRGDALSRYLKKGDPVFIDGRLTLEQWQDKQSGEKRSRLSVTAEDWQFVSSRGEGGARSREAAPSTFRPESAPASGSPPPPADDEAMAEGSGDVPF